MKNLNTNPAQLLRSIVLLTTMSALAVCPCAFGKSGRPLTERRSNLVASITDNTLTSKWGINALSRESDYIVNCSYTQYTANHNGISADSDAYGAINDVHINNRGADWVKPGEGAEGVIGLMAAARQMHGMNLPTTTYDAVLDIYFDKWIYKHRQGWQLNPSVPNYGGMADRIYYDSSGRWVRNDGPTTSVTGMMISVMWKRYEYLQSVGREDEAKHWLTASWPLAKLAGDFICRNYDPATQMIHGNSSPGDLWTADSVLGVVGLRCLQQWSTDIGDGTAQSNYRNMADRVVGGIEQMKDSTKWPNFYRFRDHSHGYAPSYGDCVDQLCFLPYEADVLDCGHPFAREISDWWTHATRAGAQADNMDMTPQIDDPKDWRYFGTHWHLFFADKPENHYLYPGPGLQLAKVEWKYAKRTSDKTLLSRACHRLMWAGQSQYSNLWQGDSPAAADSAASGIVDWRDADNYKNTAQNWARFVDTSSFMIETTLMVCFDKDTKYVPDETQIASVPTKRSRG